MYTTPLSGSWQWMCGYIARAQTMTYIPSLLEAFLSMWKPSRILSWMSWGSCANKLANCVCRPSMRCGTCLADRLLEICMWGLILPRSTTISVCHKNFQCQEVVSIIKIPGIHNCICICLVTWQYCSGQGFQLGVFRPYQCKASKNTPEVDLIGEWLITTSLEYAEQTIH